MKPADLLGPPHKLMNLSDLPLGLQTGVAVRTCERTDVCAVPSMQKALNDC